MKIESRALQENNPMEVNLPQISMSLDQHQQGLTSGASTGEDRVEVVVEKEIIREDG